MDKELPKNAPCLNVQNKTVERHLQQQSSEYAENRQQESQQPALKQAQQSPEVELCQQSHISQRNETEWKQCAKCKLRFPASRMKIHHIDCLTATCTGTGTDGGLKEATAIVFVCSICTDKVPQDSAILHKHEQSHSGEESVDSKFVCSLCKLAFPLREDFEEHSQMHKGHGKFLACQVCQAVFEHNTDLLRHTDAHRELVKACLCGAVFPNKQAFKSHQEVCYPVVRDPTSATSNSGRSYKCRLCSKIFGTVQGRLRHEHTCINRRNASNARLSEDAGKNLICSVCKQEFKFKENYRAHMRSHTGERPYTCRYCPKDFASLQGRWQHEKIHKRQSQK